MFALFKKLLLACVLVLVVSTTGARPNDYVVLAESQNTDIPETPLYPGLTWSGPERSTRDVTINMHGDAISLSGEQYKAMEEFASILPQDVLNYYSNGNLAESGWISYDAFERPDGIHYVFYDESDVYLSIEFLKCMDFPSSICISVWKSDQKSDPVNPAVIISVESSQSNSPTVTGTFGKTSPANNATNLNPASVVLSWGAYSPTPEKYSYCIKEGVACDANDPEWTGTYTNTSVTLTNLSYDKTYYWQVKAIICIACTPRVIAYADNGTVWTFKTKKATQAVIVGNVGVVGGTLSYVDGTLKTVTVDSTGAYSLTVPLNWSGTITPAKPGYVFSPQNASFSNLTAPQTIQNFNAFPGYIISGNVGLTGVTLNYTDGIPQTAISNSSGNYSFTVSNNWSGTVSPSKTGYTFSPASRNYSNVTMNQTAQNYTPLIVISGDTGTAGVTLSYIDVTAKTVTADGGGAYSLSVPLGWTGTVTPSKAGFTFMPLSRSYSNVRTSQTAQDYNAIDAPIVLSSVRVGETPTSASSVDFTVTFSESVSGVNSGDFSLTTTGLTGTGITGVSGSGATYTVTVGTGSGSGTIRLDVLDDDSIKDAANNLLGGVGAGNGDFTTGEVYEVNQFTSLSTNSYDGWIVESSESGNTGGSVNKTATTLRLGDDAANRQYRSILSFDTSALPDNAVITAVTLTFKYAGRTGTLPFSTHGSLLADVNKGAFKDNPALQIGDFNAKGTLDIYKSSVLAYTNSAVNNWYSQSFSPADFQYVNMGGVTQFRLRFTKDDNNDLGADFMKLYSGNALPTDCPRLIIEYTVP